MEPWTPLPSPSPSPSLARATALVAALALASGCGGGGSAGPPAPVFTVGGVTLRATSGAAVATPFGLDLWVSDQADTCAAITAVPQTRLTLLRLRVAPAAGGASAATLGPPLATAPAPGTGYGALTVSTLGTESSRTDTADGTVAWTAAADGSVVVDALDAGFAGTADRIRAEGLRLARCGP